MRQQIYHTYGGWVPNAAGDDLRWHTVVTGMREGANWEVWRGQLQNGTLVVLPLLLTTTEMPSDDQRLMLAPTKPEIDFSEPELPPEATE